MAAFSVRFVGVAEYRAEMVRLAKAYERAQGRAVVKLAAKAAEGLTRRFSGEDRKVRTGALRRGVASSPTPERIEGTTAARVGYGVGPSARYARITEHGGRVTPKSGKVLAMPIGKALTASGAPRFVSDDGHWLREAAPDGFWISRPGHPPIFVQKAGGKRSERLELFAIGLPYVDVKATHALEHSADEALAAAEAIISAEVDAARGAA